MGDGQIVLARSRDKCSVTLVAIPNEGVGASGPPPNALELIDRLLHGVQNLIDHLLHKPRGRATQTKQKRPVKNLAHPPNFPTYAKNA